ncbi:MAG TPA: GNAT family N-acetyltransferase [Longimicrobium sp.]
MSAASIRPFQPRDADAAAALIAAEWPHRADEAEQLRRGELHPDARRWAAADPSGGGLVAYAALWRVRDRRFRIDLDVAPAWRRRGIGGAMLETAVAAAAEDGAATVQARAYAGAADALRFLARRGFAETMRMFGLALDVRAIDPLRLAAYEQAAAAQGFALTTLAAEERRNPHSLRDLWEVYAAAQEGWRDPDPPPVPDPPMTFEAFLRRMDEFPTDPDAFFIAIHGERYAGLTGSIGTAVHPAYRGRGVANALKARAALHARTTGRGTMETCTGNPAMLRANENVGFRRTWTEVRLVRRVSAP